MAGARCTFRRSCRRRSRLRHDRLGYWRRFRERLYLRLTGSRRGHGLQALLEVGGARGRKVLDVLAVHEDQRVRERVEGGKPRVLPLEAGGAGRIQQELAEGDALELAALQELDDLTLVADAVPAV